MLTDAHNKWKSSTKAHRHGSKLWLPDTEVFSVVSGEGAGRGPSQYLGLLTGSTLAPAEQMINTTFAFRFFFSCFYESENSSSDFFQFMKIDTNLGLSSNQGGVK